MVLLLLFSECQQSRCADLEGVRDPVEDRDRRVALAPLDPADVRAVHVGARGELLLRQVFLLPQGPYRASDRGGDDGVARHLATMPAMMLMRLQPMSSR